MAWIIAGILAVIVVIFLIRDRNLRKRLPEDQSSGPDYNTSFFKFQCGFGETDIQKGRGVVSIVLVPPVPAAAIAPEAKDSDGAFGAVVRVASRDGGFVTAAMTYGDEAEKLSAGDLVICVPIAFRERIASELEDERLGWLWELRAQLDATGDPAEGWKVLREFKNDSGWQ